MGVPSFGKAAVTPGGTTQAAIVKVPFRATTKSMTIWRGRSAKTSRFLSPEGLRSNNVFQPTF
jgi:hypothetical protein